MKKHLSVLSLWLRLKLLPAVGLLAAMAALELLLFRRGMNSGETWLPTMDALLSRSGIQHIFFITFVLLLMLFSRSHSKARYTLARLRVREETGALWDALSNMGCLFLLWSVQLAAALVMNRWYLQLAAAVDPAAVGSQTVVLAFYRDSFLHFLLPLRHVDVWISNSCFFVSAGLLCAFDGYRIRREKKSFWSVLYVPMLAVSLRGGSSWPVGCTALSLALVIMALVRLVLGYRGEAAVDA